MEKLLEISKQIGFSHYAPLAMDSLIPREDVRAMCRADRCHAYGHSWRCPPACGTLDFSRQIFSAYSHGIIVQTTGQMADDFDYGVIRRTEEIHKANFSALVRAARSLYPKALPLGAGTCTICHSCTYPQKPCRFPAKSWSSMEAYGLLVSDVCTRSGLKYNYGTCTITYSSCILFNSN